MQTGHKDKALNHRDRALAEEQVGAAVNPFCFWLCNTGENAEGRNSINCSLSSLRTLGAVTPPVVEPQLWSSAAPNTLSGWI